MSSYAVEIISGVGHFTVTLWANSLAGVVVQIKELYPTATRVKIWNADSGLELIDTHFGDSYGIIRNEK